MDPDLLREVLALKQGDHLCLIYDKDPAEQLDVLLPFLRQGLENGERCVYVADDHTLTDLQDAIANYGIDVATEMERGSLCLWTREQWRQPGDLDSARKAQQVREVIDAALSEGYAGIRFGVEMTWTLGPDIDPNLLEHWEATINTIFTPDMPARIICQYSRSRLPPPVIQAALATHPVAVLDNQVCPNPFYEAPLLLEGAASFNEGQIPADWMLAQLRWARAFEMEREERIRAEIALREAEASHQRIEELLRQAEESAAELRKANAVKDEFIGLVSHELRTPITVILGNAQVLLKTLPELSRDHHDALLDLRSEAERLNRVVSNLLMLAKLEGGHIPDLEPILVLPVLERVVQEHRRKYPERKVEVHLLTSGEPSFGNPVYVEQMIANLLSNAEKYSPSTSPIDIVLGSEGGQRTVRVLDRGIGITEEDSAQMFKAFYRSPAAARLNAGIGIGLAVCKRLAEAQDGAVWAKPRDGGGAEFGFSIPLCEMPGE